jgi:hypothetical protein
MIHPEIYRPKVEITRELAEKVDWLKEALRMTRLSSEISTLLWREFKKLKEWNQRNVPLTRTIETLTEWILLSLEMCEEDPAIKNLGEWFHWMWTSNTRTEEFREMIRRETQTHLIHQLFWQQRLQTKEEITGELSKKTKWMLQDLRKTGLMNEERRILEAELNLLKEWDQKKTSLTRLILKTAKKVIRILGSSEDQLIKNIGETSWMWSINDNPEAIQEVLEKDS